MTRLALALLLTSAAVAAPVPKAKKEPSLTGQWITTERVHSGQAIKDPWVWVIDGEKLTIHDAENGGVGRANYTGTSITFSRPADGKADEYDYTHQSNGQTLVFRGRLKWDGEEWLLCFGQANGDRPAEVKAGKGVYFHRFKRIPEK
jgi:hypothetical protein